MTEATKTRPSQSSESTESAVTASPATGSPATAPARMGVDDKSISAASYANFCRVTGTPEELIIDFGLNAQTAHRLE